MVMGIFEFGRAMYIKNTLNNAARAGVRVAVVTQKYDVTSNLTGLDVDSKTLDCSNSAFFTGKNGPVYQMVCNSIYNGIPKNEVTVDIKNSDLDISAGDSVTLTLTWGSFQFITPLGPLASLASGGGDSSLNLDKIIGEASMRYE
jgi:hypothetical protein